MRTPKPIWPVINNTNNISFFFMVSAIREGQGKPMHGLKQQQLPTDAGEPFFADIANQCDIKHSWRQQQCQANQCQANQSCKIKNKRAIFPKLAKEETAAFMKCRQRNTTFSCITKKAIIIIIIIIIIINWRVVSHTRRRQLVQA